MVLIISLFWKPYKDARNKTPERITVSSDRIMVDGREYMFRDITQIKMTTPNTISGKPVRRNIKIIWHNQPIVYLLGDDTRKKPDKSVAIFEDYRELYSVLQNIFAIRAGEGKLSIFSSESM
jgi:hypothetical protein